MGLEDRKADVSPRVLREPRGIRKGFTEERTPEPAPKVAIFTR